MTTEGAQAEPGGNRDAEHLRLLSVFHYVGAAMAGLFGCFPLLHLALGVLVLTGAFDGSGDAPPRAVGLIFVVFALVFMAMAWGLAVLLILNGRFLARRRHHTFCVVVAGLTCLFVPFGTVLGVFTIVVLMRPSVQEMFRPRAGGLQPGGGG
ncbi:MAG: hypothetical protein R6V05_00160 [Candidatus Brocadiia bacterium]